MKNETVGISLRALHRVFGDDLTYCYMESGIDEDDGGDYYELYDSHGLVCLDGEEVQILGSADGKYFLLNTDGEIDREFILTTEEFNNGVFGRKFHQAE